jgi:hypothetical protein
MRRLLGLVALLLTATASADVTGPVTPGTPLLSNLSWQGGVSPPLTAPTATAGSAGNLTGTYYYYVNYITPTAYTETNVSLAQVTVTSQQVNLTSIPLSPSPLVTGRRIYRTAANAFTPYNAQLVTTLNDNTTTTYTDNLVDGSLGAYMPGINTTIPQIYRADYNGLILDWGTTSMSVGPSTMPTNQGYANTAVGSNTMFSNTGGARNTAVGIDALYNNTIGNSNVGIGPHALDGNTIGNYSVAVGYTALFTQSGAVTTPSTAVGTSALQNSNVANGAGGVAIGFQALDNNQSGQYDTAVGYQSMISGIIGSYDTAIGMTALFACGCTFSTAVGAQTLTNATGNGNTSLGYQAGLSVVAGANNLLLGPSVGSTTLTSGSNNILIGTSSAVTTVASGTSSEINIGTVIVDYAAAPTVTSGGGTSPVVTANGTHVFKITEGSTGVPATTLVVGMPAAANDWICPAILDRTSASITARQSGAASATSVTVTFSSAPANSDVIEFMCGAQ